MADPFVAEIRVVGFNFAPTGWAQCNGQVLPISQNTALFALLGTVYGGDGKSTFALPNLQGSAAMHPGQGQGLNEHFLGEMGGTETVTLLQSEIPVHTHSVQAGGSGFDNDPGLGVMLANEPGAATYTTGTPNVQLAAQTLSPAGGSLPHNNMMPYLTMNFVIALQGVFPQRP